MHRETAHRTSVGRLWRILAALTVALLMSAGAASAGSETEIRVPISTVKNSKGTVHVYLYERHNWLKPGRYIRSARVKARSGTVYASFKGIPRGTYGIAVFHDENLNYRVDTNFVGLPKEGYGFSRITPLRKPKFHEVAVNANPRAHAAVRLRY